MPKRIDARLVSDLWFFRVVAEHGSFSRAGEDLAVTQSAVTQRVQRLEARLRVQLLVREPRRLRLTTEGESLYRDIQAGFDRIASGLGRIKPRPKRRTLSISCSPSLALEWLGPRLRQLPTSDEHVGIALFADMDARDGGRRGSTSADVTIRYGPDPPTDAVADFDFPELLFPVASPELATRAFETPSSEPVTLLHDAQPWPHSRSEAAEWDLWCEARGEPWSRPRRDRFFNLAHIAYQSAVAGHGVAIGRALLIAPHLASGRLVRAVEAEPVGGVRYYVSVGKDARDQHTKAFVAWLQGELDVAVRAARDQLGAVGA